MVVALIRDLLFASKVTATARSLGVDVRIVRDATAIPDGGTLLLDLNQPGAIEAAAAWKAAAEGRTTIGFVSHVDADTIARAKAAGIDRVLARSQFVQQLPDLLASGR